jgi:hypothetical protein
VEENGLIQDEAVLLLPATALEWQPTAAAVEWERAGPAGPFRPDSNPYHSPLAPIAQMKSAQTKIGRGMKCRLRPVADYSAQG